MGNIKSDLGTASSVASGLTKSSNVESANVSFGVTNTTPTSEMQSVSELASSAIEQVSSSLSNIAQGFNQVAQSINQLDVKSAKTAG